MKIICVGHNYQSHNKEMGRKALDTSNSPILFMKPETALLTNDRKHFYIPNFTQNVHYEAEIVIRINKVGKNIAERFAHRYYNELTIGIDFTARDLQDHLKTNGLPWEIAKGFDNSAAIGTFISSEDIDIENINFSLASNEKEVQKGNTANMIHPIDKVVAYASQYFTLKTGDLLFTGTPAGVGQIRVGDILEGYIEQKKLLEIKIC